MVHTWITASIFGKLRLFGADLRGVAGIEFGVTGLLLVIGLLNAVDVGFYAYKRMEVENAAEVGAQAAYNTCVPPCTPQNCPPQQLPATQDCPGLNSAITTSIQSTSLGTAVSLASGFPAEDYRCVDSSNALQYAGSVSNPRPACAGGGTAGDYLQVGVTSPYQSLFPGSISVMSASGVTSITKTSWMRMG